MSYSISDTNKINISSSFYEAFEEDLGLDVDTISVMMKDYTVFQLAAPLTDDDSIRRFYSYPNPFIHGWVTTLDRERQAQTMANTVLRQEGNPRSWLSLSSSPSPPPHLLPSLSLNRGNKES